MRIVHFSDIHLSKLNHNEFIRRFRDKLIEDLERNINNEKKIDLIVITGDLIDKSGDTLLDVESYKDFENPYDIFEAIFITPLCNNLGISKSQILFIPGNHDIDRTKKLFCIEYKIHNNINSLNTEDYLEKNRKNDFLFSKNIERFKKFEHKYHFINGTPNYFYTNNHSTFIYKTSKNENIGILLMNDSWRCSGFEKYRKLKSHYLGHTQIDESMDNIIGYDTRINICLLHHALSDFEDKNEIERLLNYYNIELILFGHYHEKNISELLFERNKCVLLRTKATLNNPNAIEEKYQSGYQVIDLDLVSRKISKINYRKYDYNKIEFIDDGFKNDISFIKNRSNTKNISYNIKKSDFKKD